jgi:hypothetical protein
VYAGATLCGIIRYSRVKTVCDASQPWHVCAADSGIGPLERHRLKADADMCLHILVWVIICLLKT